MSLRSYLQKHFRETALISLGNHPQVKVYAEALADSLKEQSPEVTSEIMRILSKKLLKRPRSVKAKSCILDSSL